MPSEQAHFLERYRSWPPQPQLVHFAVAFEMRCTNSSMIEETKVCVKHAQHLTLLLSNSPLHTKWVEFEYYITGSQKT